VLHVALLLRLQTGRSVHLVARKASQVEIQITRPPPPKPVVVPPQDNHPPPVKLASPRPQPRIVPPEPVHAAPVAGGDAPAIEAPPAEEGTAAPAEPAAPVVQAAAPPPPAPVVAAKEGANYLKNPRPAYPRLAMREGWQGSVLLRVRVLPDGRPGEITVQRSSGRGVLDDAATETVKAWTFVPATQGGNPIAGWVNVPIEFRLQ
jgi:protein TonB